MKRLNGIQSDEEATGGKLYTQKRWELLEEREKKGWKIYPYYSPYIHMPLPEYRARFNDMKPSERLENCVVEVVGRIHSKRQSGQKIYFYDLHSGGTSLQIMALANKYQTDFEEFDRLNNQVLRKGDILYEDFLQEPKQTN